MSSAKPTPPDYGTAGLRDCGTTGLRDHGTTRPRVHATAGPSAVIYLVDDDESALRATARLLRASGYEVKPFASPAELLGQVVPDEPGCMLLDLDLPQVSGLQLQDCLRSLSFCDEIVLVDSGSSDDTVQVAKSAGVRVIQQDWLGYGPQKRLAVEQATHDWVLCVDADERIAKAIELGEAFALGGLDHEGAGDGPAHGGGVVAVIHQALGGVVHFEAVFFPAAQVDDALVGDEAAVAAIEDGEEGVEARGHVVGGEDGQLGCFGEARLAHHADIHPGDDEDARAAPGGGGDGADAGRVGGQGRDDGVRGQVGREVRGHAYGADTGAAAAVRDGEGLV